MGERLLVTGGTGFIGCHAVRELLEAGHALRLLLRPTSDTAGLDAAGLLEACERATGDVLDEDALVAAMQGVHGVVHLAGDTSFLPAHRERVERVNVEGTRRVLLAARRAGVGRVLLASSMAAVGASRSPDVLLDEGSPWEVDGVANAYVRAKRRAEEVAWELAGDGLEVVAVNPTIVIGPGDHRRSSTAMLLNFARGRMPGVVRGGSGYVDVRDVARGIRRAWERLPAGRRVILSSENLAHRDYAALVARLAGVRPPREVPAWAAWGLAFLNRWIVARLDPSRADFDPDTVRVASAWWFADTARARRELGLVDPIPVARAARDTLRWALAHGQLPPATPELRNLAEEGAP